MIWYSMFVVVYILAFKKLCVRLWTIAENDVNLKCFTLFVLVLILAPIVLVSLHLRYELGIPWNTVILYNCVALVFLLGYHIPMKRRNNWR